MVIANAGYPSLDSIVSYISTNLSSLNNASLRTYLKREIEEGSPKFIVFACLIPVLVLGSGLFAGLTLGYMSLDETQLNVLSISGTEQQKLYAEKIKPIRKNGHLLLVTLLLCNMIFNEALPVIADPLLGGGVQSVVVSTALIVIFAEIIPQSLCTRHGLYIGAKFAPFVRVLLWTMGLVAWPVAKLLEWVLGPHHGIIYRRTELKELIAMHSNMGHYGGDLKNDTVTIIGATLDLQEKVVSQAMTPIKDVFMLSIDTKLDYDTLRQICLTGHSRVPVYEEIEVPTSKVIAARNKAGSTIAPLTRVSEDGKFMTVRRIIGILLVKQCVLLDPGDAVPLRQIPLNKVPFVPNNESLLGILDKFQTGRSHMAIVSRFSVEKAASVKQAVKQSLTQRIKHTVGISDDSSSGSESEDETASKSSSKGSKKSKSRKVQDDVENDGTLRGSVKWDKEIPSDAEDEPKRGFPLGSRKHRGRSARRTKSSGNGSGRNPDIEMGSTPTSPKPPSFTTSGLEQWTPADAVLAKSDAEDFLQILDPAIMPMGIITLEDVLEELIGEEIYDEFDPHHQGAQLSSYIPPDSGDDNEKGSKTPAISVSPPATTLAAPSGGRSLTSSPIIRPIAVPALKGFNFLRSRSAPPTPRDEVAPSTTSPPVPALPEPEVTIPQVSHSPAAISPATTPVPLPIDTASDVPKLPEAALGRAGRPTAEPSLSPLSAPATATLGAPPSSRSGSPAPPLEAILLDRKRRGLSSAGTSVPSPASSTTNMPATSRVVSPSLSLGKGGKSGFKSSPLGGTDRSGVVIAEAVKKNTGASTSTSPGGEEASERTFADSSNRD